MKNLSIALAIALALPLIAADPAGFGMWSGADVKAAASAAKLDEHKVGLARVGSWGNHSLLSIRREGDGEAEVHETQVDVIFVTSGEGTLIVGGTMVGGHPTTPGEIRGTSIQGGVSKKMAPGDVFHIPAKVPHQMLVPKSLVFEVVKVETK
jgi:mannose-6-phosphate isomerase-like protein (cupin superfamily)